MGQWIVVVFTGSANRLHLPSYFDRLLSIIIKSVVQFALIVNYTMFVCPTIIYTIMELLKM